MVLTDLIVDFGEFILDGIDALGKFILFLASAAWFALIPPYKPRLTIRQIRIIGAESFFLIVLVSAFTGMVLGLQGYNSLRRFGSEGVLGTLVALTLVRELGPVLAALMIAARAGSAMAAELGSMQSTEQIDALTVMAINPVQYLVSPRMLAGIISFPLLTSIFDVVGIYGGYMVGVDMLHAPGSSYMSGIAQNMSGHDIATGACKALVFGLVVMWVCCYK